MAEIPEKVSESLANVTTSLFRQAISFIDRHFRFVILLAIALLATAIIPIALATFRARYFTILTGPTGSTADEDGRLIATATNRQAATPPYCHVTVQQTDGFDQNRSDIANDSSGSVIGFGHDGFGDPTKLRILLPLEESYLHILCSRALFKKLERCCHCKVTPLMPTETAAPEPPASGTPIDLTGEQGAETRSLGFYELFCLINDNTKAKCEELKNGGISIAFGPDMSVTRQIAMRVLNHFNISRDQYKEFAAKDWEKEIKEDLLKENGNIGIVFFLGPKNTSFAQELVQKNAVFPLGLGDDAKAIADSFSNPIATVTYRSGIYGRNIPEQPDDGSFLLLESRDRKGRFWRFNYPCFCDEITTLKTRRVLLCSKAMSNSDALSIANLARSALSERTPQLQWEDSADGSASGDSRYSFLPHSGTTLLRDEKEPALKEGIWKQFLAIVSAVLLAIVGVVARHWNRKLTHGDYERVAVTTDANAQINNEARNGALEASRVGRNLTYKWFASSIEDMGKRLVCEPIVLSDDMRGKWQLQINNIEERLRGALESGRLSPEGFETLQGAIKELQFDLSQTDSVVKAVN